MQRFQEYKSSIDDGKQQSDLRKYYAANKTIDELVKSGELLPPMNELEGELQPPISDNVFKRKCTDALQRITADDRDSLMERLADEARALNRMKIYQAPFRTHHHDAFSAIELLDGKNIQIFVLALDPLNLSYWKSNSRKKGITIQPFSYMIKCLSGSGAVTKYAVEDCPQEGSDSSRLAKETTEVPFKEGTIMSLDKGKEGLTFSRCEEEAIFLQVSLRHSGLLTMPQYSVDSLEHVGNTYSEPVTPRIQTATVALRMLGYSNIVGLLRPFLSSENMYLRWQAAREIFMADPDAAKEVFSAMQKDPSSKIRKSATRCLVDYYGESECQ